MKTFVLQPRGPYALAASQRFFCSFTPASGSASSDVDTLRLVFRLDGTFAPVGVALREAANGDIHGEVSGAGDVDKVKAQAARILSLDHDATDFARLGEREPAIGSIQQTLPGFRPVCFASPYEAAVWGILAQRIAMKQAAAIRARVAAEHGDAVEVAGVTMQAFPSPEVLLSAERSPFVSEEKWERLRGIALAALDGKLDANKLRALEVDEALEQLGQLRGVGGWTAGHILLRGCATADVPTMAEPRVRRAAQFAYGLAKEPDDAELAELFDRWRPWRTWTAVLLATHLNRAGLWHTAEGKRGGPTMRVGKRVSAASRA
jgi:DNA-3-methyladenine glycosylase II